MNDSIDHICFCTLISNIVSQKIWLLYIDAECVGKSFDFILNDNPPILLQSFPSKIRTLNSLVTCSTRKSFSQRQFQITKRPKRNLRFTPFAKTVPKFRTGGRFSVKSSWKMVKMILMVFLDVKNLRKKKQGQRSWA